MQWKFAQLRSFIRATFYCCLLVKRRGDELFFGKMGPQPAGTTMPLQLQMGRLPELSKSEFGGHFS